MMNNAQELLTRTTKFSDLNLQNRYLHNYAVEDNFKVSYIFVSSSNTFLNNGAFPSLQLHRSNYVLGSLFGLSTFTHTVNRTPQESKAY